MKVLLVDDEAPARLRLRQLLERIDGTEIVGEAGSGEEAVAACARLQPELVFLDIRMPGMDGLEAARHIQGLEEPPAVIFVTAFEEHALAAFEARAAGYLLKPVRLERLRSAMAGARHLNRAQLQALSRELGQGRRTHFSVRTHQGIRLIPVEEVLYLQAELKYVTLHHTGGEALLDESLRQIEEEFGDRFLRIHRKTLVARAALAGVERAGPSRHLARIRGRAEGLEISRRMLPAVRRALKRA